MRHERGQAFGIDAFGDRLDDHIRVDRGNRLPGGIDLGLAYACLGVHDLALQVGEIDGVVVHDGQAAYSRAGQVQRHRGTQAARAQDQGMRIQQLLLPLDTQFIEEQVAQ